MTHSGDLVDGDKGIKKISCGSVTPLSWNACDMIENIDTFNEVKFRTSIGYDCRDGFVDVVISSHHSQVRLAEGSFSLNFYKLPTQRVLLNQKKASSSSVISTYCIFSCVAINEPMKVVTKRLLTWQISSGTNQIVAPIFLAILILSLAFIYASSSERPGVTRS